ncbi:MAG: FG-GAP repeat domain-containing protein, partial [Vicinamibacterales bacterium]
MTHKKTLFLFSFIAVVSVMAGVGGIGRLRAQSTPPRPAVSVRQLPSFVSSTLATDLNEDGRPDLIGAGTALQVALGRGDGTFGTPRSLGVPGRPLAVGDFDGDGHIDVLITGVSILPGRGDGTFDAPRVIDPSANPTDNTDLASR